MSTQTRLDAYLQTEAEILRAQEVRGNDRTVRFAELVEVRKAISALQSQLAREKARAARGMRFNVANLNR